VRIELEVAETIIRSAAFTANACAICTASASLLTERVSGASIEAARGITDAETLGALGTELPAGRLLCAILPVRTLREALTELDRAT
jgi:NifU-like protein involved in Fe-S cluster formation